MSLLWAVAQRPLFGVHTASLQSLPSALKQIHTSSICLKQRNPISLAEGRLQKTTEKREDRARLTGTNDVLYRKDLPRVVHSWETGVAYLKSQTYYTTYGDHPVWVPYRRNLKGPAHRIPKARDSCFTKEQRFVINNPCPLCRDEYLVVDYRNPELLKQFLDRLTGDVMDIKKCGLCKYQHNEVLVNFIRAKEHGTLEFDVPFRAYDYRHYYAALENESDEEAAQAMHIVNVSDKPEPYPEKRPYPYITFPEHMPCRIPWQTW